MISNTPIYYKAMMRIVIATYLTIFAMMHSIRLPSLTYSAFSHGKLCRIALLKSFSLWTQIILFTNDAH